MTISKNCRHCGKEFFRNAKESTYNWRVKQFCTPKCRTDNTNARNSFIKKRSTEHSNTCMPSPEAQEAAYTFLYKQKPWTTEADRTG